MAGTGSTAMPRSSSTLPGRPRSLSSRSTRNTRSSRSIRITDTGRTGFWAITASPARSAPCRGTTPRRTANRRATAGTATSATTVPTARRSPKRRVPIRGGTSSFRVLPRRIIPRTSSTTRIPISIRACGAAASSPTIRPPASPIIPSPRPMNVPWTAANASRSAGRSAAPAKCPNTRAIRIFPVPTAAPIRAGMVSKAANRMVFSAPISPVAGRAALPTGTLRAAVRSAIRKAVRRTRRPRLRAITAPSSSRRKRTSVPRCPARSWSSAPNAATVIPSARKTSTIPACPRISRPRRRPKTSAATPTPTTWTTRNFPPRPAWTTSLPQFPKRRRASAARRASPSPNPLNRTASSRRAM